MTGPKRKQKHTKRATPTMGALPLRFQRADSAHGINRATLVRLAKTLGYTETQTVHYALKKLAREMLPAYEADDGALTPREMVAIRVAEPQGRLKSVKSTLL